MDTHKFTENTQKKTLIHIKVGNLEGGRRLVKDYGSQAEQAKKFSKLAERNKVQMLNMEEDRRKSQEKNVRYKILVLKVRLKYSTVWY